MVGSVDAQFTRQPLDLSTHGVSQSDDWLATRPKISGYFKGINPALRETWKPLKPATHKKELKSGPI